MVLEAGRRGGVCRASCSPTREEPGLTPLRSLDPDTVTQLQRKNLHRIRGCKKILGVEDQELALVLQLSSEANAFVAAINGALAPRQNGIQGQMGMLAGQMTSLKSDVVQKSAQVQHHDQRMSEFLKDSWKILQLEDP